MKFFLLLSILLIISCSKNENLVGERDDQINTTIETTISVGQEVTSRTSIDGTVVKWSDADALAVFDDLGTTNAKFSLVEGGDRKIGNFKGMFNNITSIKRNIYAIYPYGVGVYDNKTYTFTLPFVQMQNGAVDPLNLGRYCYMVSTPVYDAPKGGLDLYMNQLMAIVDFNIKNIPSDIKVSQVTMKAKSVSDKPFITHGNIDLTQNSSNDNFLKTSPLKSVNEFSVFINNAPSTNFTASLVLFPPAVSKANIDIVVTTTNSSGLIKTYTFEKTDLNLSIFTRASRTATTLDFLGKTADVTNNESYNVWDGATKTQPDNFDSAKKTATIMRASDLAWIAAKTFIYDGFKDYTILMGANLDLGGVFDGINWSGKQWSPIGASSYNVFKGNFDGNGYKIRNIYISSSLENSGLFGACTGAMLKNIIIERGSITSPISYASVGGISGYVSSVSSIINCVNNADIDAYSAGGICGYVSSASITIDNCTNSGRISAMANAGGICGNIYSSSATTSPSSRSITNCVNYGEILSSSSVSSAETGGICGNIFSSSNTTSSMTITNCINNGNVSSYSSSYNDAISGGIYGTASNASINIANCVNNGEISSTSTDASSSTSTEAMAGGVCGATDSSLITNCINNGNISTTSPLYSYAGGICGEISTHSSSSSPITITRCTNNGGVTSSSSAGGICGEARSNSVYLIKITNCVNNKDISSSLAAGGICGKTDYVSSPVSSIIIVNSINLGNISSTSTSSIDSAAGGIGGSVTGSVMSCVNKGELIMGYYKGGIVALMELGVNSTISSCYSIGNNEHPGIIGVIKWNTSSIYYCYYTASSSIGSGSATINKGGQFSYSTWPDTSISGWGKYAPIGWDTSTMGTWISPWSSLGYWNQNKSSYPVLETGN